MIEPDPYSIKLPDAVPLDDGGYENYVGVSLPDVELSNGRGEKVRLQTALGTRAVVWIYPATGVPGVDPADGWDDIPGAAGCTVQALGFKSLGGEFYKLGFKLLGISAQSSSEQAEFHERVGLGIDLLSDATLVLQRKLHLPTFSTGGRTFYKRSVLVVKEGVIIQTFYPIFPPANSALRVLHWLTERSQESSATGLA